MYKEETDFDYESWDEFIRYINENSFKIHLKEGVIGKNISFFGSGYELKNDKEGDTNLSSIFEIQDSSFDVPNSFMCKITNENWKGNYLTRDERQKPSGKFGYNKRGGELIKVNLMTPVAKILDSDPIAFHARIFVEGKDKDYGTYFGFFSENGKLKWGNESLAEVVHIKSTNWS